MSILMLLDLNYDSTWPSEEAIIQFRKTSMATGRRPVKVFTHQDISTTNTRSSFEEIVANEFEHPNWRGYDGTRLVLAGGFRDPTLAERLYREHNIPVNIVFSTPDLYDDWINVFWTMAGITAAGWLEQSTVVGEDMNVITSVLDALNGLTDDYHSYIKNLRYIPSTLIAEVNTDVYTSILDAYGDKIQAIEPVLDAILEQLCGTTNSESDAKKYDDCNGSRWMSTIVEYGDKAAEDASRLQSWHGISAEAAANYIQRTTRMATSFAETFWIDCAKQPTDTDRILTTCLIENIRAAATDSELTDLSTDQFDMCLTAKFIASRRWKNSGRTKTDHSIQSMFQPEMKCCEKFMAINHLLDLMAIGDDDDQVFCRSHVELLESYILPQRLLEYVTRSYSYDVRYFELCDALVFRFMNGKREKFIERYREHRFIGPRNFKEFHHEMFQIVNILRLLILYFTYL